ncbi:MAG: flagellar biosynthesis protein FlhF [Mycobacterium leprae]
MHEVQFVARTLREALALVRAQLGPNAVVMRTEEIKVGGFLGFFRQKRIRVTACAPLQGAAAAWSVADAPLAPTAPVQPAEVRSSMAGMRDTITGIMDRVTDSRPGRLESVATDLKATLLAAGIAEEAAQDLVARVRSQSGRTTTYRQMLGLARELMSRDLQWVEPIRPGRRVVTLIGPTGVGKTTTLAKLAAQSVLQQSARVALVTLDTFKIGAVDQLRIYSEILGVPLEVAYDPVELSQVLARLSDRDLILVDTAGRSPRNATQLEELKNYMDVLNPDETYLVMSLTSGYRDALRIVDNYEAVGFDHLLFTKWDEAETPGLIYSVAHQCRRPLSYITTGQNVPEDIEVADPEAITRAILGASFE